MITLRSQHIQAFQEVRLPDFENYMVEHLKDFSPMHSQTLGEDGIRRLIRMGIVQAKPHGFTYRGPVKFYIETMILLGCAFDTDPQYPWAGTTLVDPAVLDQTARADRLHARFMEYLDATGGPHREFLMQALLRVRQMSLEALSVSSNTFESEIVRRMREIHPEKVAYIGEDALRGLFRRAKAEAQKYAVATDTGVSLFIGLMFLTGHGFAGDPKFPWVANTLTNPVITDPDTRIERLYSKAMTYLDHMLQPLEVS